MAIYQRKESNTYFYDQLGSYYSEQPSDTSLWTIERFVEEVEQVRQALNLDSTNFYILGTSWGGDIGHGICFEIPAAY